MSNSSGDTSRETPSGYQALMAGKGIVELADWTCLSLRGADRMAFLHNFCTNDIKQIEPDGACEAFLTDVKGKIIGHVLVACSDDALLLVTVPRQGSRIAQHLDRYLIREDVQIIDLTLERSCWLTTSADSPTEIAGKPVVTARCQWLRPVESRMLIVGADKSSLLEWTEQFGIMQCDRAALEAARIEAGTPWFDIDFDELNLPQEIGRNDLAISFTKGCYLGQETVARIDALGHVNQQLVGLKFSAEAAPTVGIELSHQGKAVGTLTSVAYSPKLRSPLGLGIVRRAATAAGCQLDWSGGTCSVVALPVGEN